MMRSVAQLITVLIIGAPPATPLTITLFEK
jgi:hypothetical protein